MREQSTDGSMENLERVFRNLRSLSGDVESCAVLGKDGRLLYSSHGPGVDRERISAMLTALFAIAGRMARQGGKEHAARLRINTGLGHLLLVRLEGRGALVGVAPPGARVGLALYDMHNARGEVEKAIREDRR